MRASDVRPQKLRRAASLLTPVRALDRAFSSFRLAPGRVRRQAILLLLLLGLTACRPSGTGAPGGQALQPAIPAPPAEPAAWRPENFPGRIRAVKTQPGLLQVELTYPAGAPAPQEPVHFDFCLPPRQPLALRIRRYAVGTTVVQALVDAPPRTDGAAPAPTPAPGLKPEDTLSLAFQGFMRDNAIYRLTVEPNFFGPWQGRQARNPGELSATVEIAWTPAAGEAGFTPLPPAARGMTEVVRHIVANPQDVEHWRMKDPPLLGGLQPRPSDPRSLAPDGASWFRFRIADDGLYRLTARDLARAGAIAPGAGASAPDALARVRIFARGQGVPLWRVKLAGGEEALLFYGWKSRTPYDPLQVYWLTLSDKAPAPAGPAADPATLAGTPLPLASLHRQATLDRDNVLKVHHKDAFFRIDTFDWLDTELIADQPTSVPLRLEAPLPLAPGAALRGDIRFYPEGADPSLWSGTEVELRYGSRTLAHFKFTPEDTSFTRTIELPALVFRDNRTLLTLDVTHATTASLPSEDSREGIWLDWVKAAYEGYPALVDGRLILDAPTVGASTTHTLFRLGLAAPGAGLFALAVDPAAQTARRLPLEGGQLTFAVRGTGRAEVFDTGAASLAPPPLEPASWHDELLSGESPDVLIVSHAMFLESLQPLLELNRKRGLTTRVVDVQQIYDLFSDGMISPLAIRDFLASAALHWSGGLPQDLLLFGDCTEDYLDQYRSAARNLVPSYIHGSGPEQCASDYWYSVLIGEDTLPDLIVSRISVASVEDARAVVDKSVRYAAAPLPGPWRGRVALVADNMLDYREMAERARRNDLPVAIQTRRIYLDELPLEDNWYLPPNRLGDRAGENTENSIRKVSSVATHAIRDTLNSGTTVMEYLGHGSPNLWAHERIWYGGGSDKRDSLSLKARGRYAFIINYTCATGKIDYPIVPWNVCITEDLLRTPDGGAIGLFVPSGSGSPPKQEILMHEWHRALFRDRVRGIGELATLVRARYAMAQPSEYHLFMYVLLGDPTAELQLATQWRDLEVTPAVAVPGTRQLQVALTGLDPEAGQAQLWVENEQGETVWQGQPFDYRGGALAAPAQLPAALPSPQRLRVALYAADPQTERDLLAAGWVTLERPAVLITSARATRTPEKGAGFALELKNMGRGPSGECNVQVRACPSDPSAPPLASQTLTLAAGEHRRVELAAPQGALPAGAQGAPPCFEAVLTLPQPPDDPALANPQRTRFALAPEPGWIGWVPALGGWQSRPAGDAITLCALSGAPPAPGLCAALRGVNDNLLTTFPLTFTAQGGAWVSTVAPPTDFRRKLTAAAAVELLERPPGAPPRRFGRMSLGDLPRSAPALRLIQDSVITHPAPPSDGETVFVTFNVENRGDAPTDPARPALLDKPLANGGRELPFRSGLDHASIPVLAPGRSWPVTLRWDPDDNAGIQPLTIDANPGAGRGEAAVNEQSMPYRLYVHTKSRLALQSLKIARKSKDPADRNNYILLEEVLNEGETDAHNVEVRFFRLPGNTEANLLQTVRLEKVPAKGKALARLECQLDLAAGPPHVEVRLQGSAQSISN